MRATGIGKLTGAGRYAGQIVEVCDVGRLYEARYP
jgi:hypothetical protein